MQISAEPTRLKALTPLYHFSSDVNEIYLAFGLAIRKFVADDWRLHDVNFAAHMTINKPDYMIWFDPLAHGKISKDLVRMWEAIAGEPYGGETSAIGSLQQNVSELCEAMLFEPMTGLMERLHLYKPGRLRAGETFVVVSSDHQRYATVASDRCSSFTLDYKMLQHGQGSYHLSSTEVPFLTAFSDMLLGPNTTVTPTVSAAIHLYKQEADPRQDVLNALTALEALLLFGKEGELSYRLALRVASLLGTDAESRSNILREMRGYYDLRSKIIHGVAFKRKHVLQIENLKELREILRRVILSMIALQSADMSDNVLDNFMDEMLVDESKRTWAQSLASKLLHAEIRRPPNEPSSPSIPTQ